MKADAAITEDPIPLSPRSRFRAAMILAMAADALQIVVFPLFAEGALSPADDVLDVAVAAVLVHLLGWHWGISASIPCRTRARSRSGSLLDACGRQRLSQVEADHDHHRRNSRPAPGAKRPAKFFVSRESFKGNTISFLS